MSECAYQFRFEKWNCPESAFNLNPVESLTRKGTSLNPPSRLTTSLDPVIPNPLARIGSSKPEKDSIMSVLHQKSKISGKTNEVENLSVDAYEILRPSIGHRDFQPTLSDNFDQNTHKNKNDRPINREAALVRAMTSAGITHTLTKNCSTGDFTNCVCDRYE